MLRRGSGGGSIYEEAIWWNLNVTEENLTYGATTIVSLTTPINASNTTALSLTFNYSFTSNVTAMNCSLFIDGVRINYNETALNNTNSNFTATYSANRTHTWYVNCTNTSALSGGNVSASWNFTHASLAERNVTVYDADLFYSAFTGNDMINISANFSGTGDPGSLTVIANCSAVMNYTYNITRLVWDGRTYSGNCTATTFLTNLSGANYVPRVYNISINATGTSGILLTSNLSVYFYHLNYPTQAGTCFRFSADSANMSRVLNFSGVTLGLGYEVNGSAACQGTALPWNNSWKTVARVNYTGFDITNPNNTAKFENLTISVVNVTLNRPRTFGSARVYVNSGSFSFLNSTANITFYDLPFAGYPHIIPDADSRGTVTYGWTQGPFNATYGSMTGNLSVKITSFTGYNVTDNVTPTIRFLQPVNGFNGTGTNVTFNVTINGTGTQLSQVDINFTYGSTTHNFTYNNVTGSNTANCTYAALGSENLTCFLTAGVGYGYWQVNVTAVDYGGAAGNRNTSTIAVNLLGATTTVVSLVSPANASNTTSMAGNFTFNFISNVTAMNCSLFIDNSRVTYYDNVSNNSNYILNATYSANRTHTWYVNCTNASALSNGNVSTSWNFTHASLAERNVTVYDTDLFYSAFTGNNIINISANFSGTGDAGSLTVIANCSAVMNYTYNITRLVWNGRTYSGNCTAITHLLNQSYHSYIPTAYTIPINVTGATANDVLSTTLTVYFHNLGQPTSAGTCFRFRADSTNLSRVTNFSGVALGLGYEVNGSATCQGTALPWGDSWKTVARVNYTTISIVNPDNAAKMENLTISVVNVTLNRPRTFGSARVYVNSGSLSFLNSTANITFYDLPFAGYPYIIPDADSRGTVTWGWTQGPYNASYGTATGNLSLKVTSFSGYNVTDNVTPTILFNYPVNTFNSTTTTNITLNVSINGTGTQLSMVDINFTQGSTVYNFTYNNITGSNTANCTYAALGGENLTCSIMVGLGSGTWQINVTAVDYGGASGNSNTSTITVNLQGQPDLIVSSSLLTNGYFTNATGSYNSVNLTVRNIGTDDSEESSVFIRYNASNETISIPQLAIGEAISLNVPVRCMPQDQNFRAMADYGNNVEELNEYNNNASLYITACPDLMVQLTINQSVNLTNQSGTYFRVSVITTNNATTTSSSSWTHVIHLNQNADFQVPPLFYYPSTSYFWAKCYATETTLTAQADYYNEVNETDETNNGASIIIPSCLPDYKVEVAAVNNSNNVTFEVRTYNAGLGDALSSSYTNDFYYLLELNYVPPLLANQTHIYYRDVMCSPQQNVSFWAYSDSTDTVPESNELNNFGNATGMCRDSPDLVVSLGIADTFTNASGTFHEIDATVTNIGIVVSGPSDTLFTYGTSNLGTRRVHALFPTQSNSTRITVGCMLEDAVFSARADYYNAVAEASEINNIASITIPHCVPTVDLIVSSMQLPQIMLTGRNYEVPVITRNNGTGITLPSITRVSIAGIEMAEISIPSLGTGETYSGTALLYCPSAGRKMVLAIADADGEVMEANEQNNERQASVACMNLSIGPKPQPNFTIDSIGGSPIKEEEGAKGAEGDSGAEGGP